MKKKCSRPIIENIKSSVRYFKCLIWHHIWHVSEMNLQLIVKKENKFTIRRPNIIQFKSHFDFVPSSFRIGSFNRFVREWDRINQSKDRAVRRSLPFVTVPRLPAAFTSEQKSHLFVFISRFPLFIFILVCLKSLVGPLW